MFPEWQTLKIVKTYCPNLREGRIFAVGYLRNIIMYKIKFQIGEFAKLCDVTVKTLLHYEKLGLLVPAEVDKWNGYRYYLVEQMQQMQTIKKLKMVGFSLDEICDLMATDSQAPGRDLLLAKIRETESQLQMLLLRRNRLRQMAETQEKINNMKDISIQSLPAITVASYRKVIASYDEIGSLCVNVIGPEMARLGCECPLPGYCFSVEHNKTYSDHDIDFEYCEQVSEAKTDSDIIKFKQLPAVPQAVCIKCYGPYDRLYQHYVDAFAYVAEMGYEITGLPRANYVDGCWNQSDPERWLTIIQIPIGKAAETSVTTGNRLQLFCCPLCGTVSMAYGKMTSQCCGSNVSPLPVKKADENDRPKVSEVDGEYMLEYNNPMTKELYIAAVVVERYDRATLIRLFPEQEALVRIDMLRGAKVYTIYRQQSRVWATLDTGLDK